jgi:hypothetical protein
MTLSFTANPRPIRRLEPVRKDRAQKDLLAQLIGRLEPRLASAVMTGLEAMGDAIPLDALVAALESGDIGRVLALISMDAAVPAMAAAQDGLQDGVYAAGALTASAIAPRLSGAAFAFDRLNPTLIRWLQTYSLGLIRQITDSTREGIRSYLIAGMTEGANPKDVARQIKQVVGLTERQAQAVANFRRELETFHQRRTGGGYLLGSKPDKVNGTQVFRPDEDGLPMDGITERRLRDFRFDGQLKRAATTGRPLSPEQIDKMVAAYARKYKAYRARTIARTEAIRANNMGIQEAWRQAIEAGKVSESLVRRQWIVARDERLCEICAPIPRLNPKHGVKQGQPFATPKGPMSMPPAHPNCRCTMVIRMWEASDLQEQ